MSKTLIPKSFKASIDRALHNLYTEKSTTFHPMTAVPIFYRRMMRGDSFDFGVLESILRSEPTFSPLLSNWRLRFEWYFDSDANRYGWVDNNTRLTSQEVMNRKHHRYITYRQGDESSTPPTDVFGRGCISDYAGIAPGYIHFTNGESEDTEMYGNTFNVDFHLTYLNIIRNYHVNRQFPNIPYTTGFNSIAGIQGTYSYSLDDLDNLFMFLRSCPNGVLFTPYFETCDAPNNMVEYYGDSLIAFYDYLRATEYNYGGLFCTQFEPDLYQNILNKDRGLLQATIMPNDDGFTIEEFRLKNHLQGLYDKIFVSGGTDRDLSRTIWGIDSNRQYDIPELICVHSEIIGTNLVTSSTAGEVVLDGEDEPLKNVPGSMAGNLNARRGAGRIQKFTAKTPGSLMCIVTLTPLVAYSQNIERHLLEHNFMDEFTPDMARKGFENVPMSDYCVLPEYDAEEGIWLQRSAPSDIVGKQVAWLREMTSVNRVHGEFSNNGEKRDWILLRNYQVNISGNGIRNQVSPYGNPLQYQYPFVSQDLYSPNFHIQVAIKCDAVRPVPRRFMPNLGN